MRIGGGLPLPRLLLLTGRNIDAKFRFSLPTVVRDLSSLTVLAVDDQ